MTSSDRDKLNKPCTLLCLYYSWTPTSPVNWVSKLGRLTCYLPKKLKTNRLQLHNNDRYLQSDSTEPLYASWNGWTYRFVLYYKAKRYPLSSNPRSWSLLCCSSTYSMANNSAYKKDTVKSELTLIVLFPIFKLSCEAILYDSNSKLRKSSALGSEFLEAIELI